MKSDSMLSSHHCGGIMDTTIKDDEKVIFTAQLFFFTPSSDIGNTKRSNRRNSQMSTYSHGQLSTLNGLGEDLFLEWDHKYSADQFPPASKFLGRVDKAKNRHIQKNQIHLLPKIEILVLSFEEKFKDITVDSVWLIKKTKQDDGFQLSWKGRQHVGNVLATCWRRVGDVLATCQNVANLDPTCVLGPTHNSKIAELTQNLSVGYPYIRTHIYVPEYNTTMVTNIPYNTQ
jgi:hypothetical protein